MAKRKTPKMEKVTTIETTELETIQELVSKTNQGNLEIGRLETQKHKVMHMMEENDKVMQALQGTLEEKYGKVNIDIKTGEISPLEVETTI
jgi:predicted enzyme involved in methoxymalonyl-ACP biosynthesis